MKTGLIIVCMAILASGATLVAQNNSVSVEQIGDCNRGTVQQAGRCNDVSVWQWSVETMNESWIQQFGADNRALLLQSQGARDLDPNRATILQTSSTNKASVIQYGGGIESMVSQEGRDNNADVSVTGRRVLSRVLQNGADNRIVQELDGVELNYLLQQNGYRNTIIQYETGENAKTYRVTQTGHDLNIRITNFSPPK